MNNKAKLATFFGAGLFICFLVGDLLDYFRDKINGAALLRFGIVAFLAALISAVLAYFLFKESFANKVFGSNRQVD
jgi:cell shape-determining protein MreD